MAALEVELDGYFIPDDHIVWKCSAGKTHRFANAVREAFTVFPDVRGLNQLEGEPSSWLNDDLVRAIAKDRYEREVASKARQNKVEPHAGITPADRKVLRFLRRIWFDAKKGDLVVVPSDGYDKEVLFGEMLGDPGDIRRVEAKDGEYIGTYFGRAVAWIATPKKIDLPAELIGELHKRDAVFAMAEPRRRDAYRIAYRNFIYKGDYVAEFRTEKEKFTAEDAAVVMAWLNGIQVMDYAREQGDDRPGEHFRSLGLDELPDGRAGELKININSPGEIFIKTKTPLAFSMMVLFALSGCDSKQIVDEGVTVKLKSVAGAATSGAKQAIESDVKGLNTAFGEERIEQRNSVGRRAASKAKITTDAALKRPR